MGVLDRILGKNIEQTAEEKELIDKIEQIRTFPGGEWVLDRINLIDFSTGKLTTGTEITVSRRGKATSVFNVKNLGEDVDCYFSLWLYDDRIDVTWSTSSNIDGEKYTQCFDAKSHVELAREMSTMERGGIGRIGRSSTITARRSKEDIEKVEYQRLQGPDTVVDISWSPADISSLDALWNSDDQQLYEWSNRSTDWDNIKRKILESENKEGCGQFISEARGYKTGDLAEVLINEGRRAHTLMLLKEDQSMFGSIRYDRLGYRTTKTSEEEKYDIDHGSQDSREDGYDLGLSQ